MSGKYVFLSFKWPSNAKVKSSLEVQVLECEMRLHDAGGLHSGPQHILLRGDVIRLGYPLQVVQVAAGRGNADVRGLLSTSVT